MVFKDKKRSFSDDESDKLAYKRPRQLDHGIELASFVENVSPNDNPENSSTLGEESFDTSQGEERPVTHTITELSVTANKLIEKTAHGSISSLSWASTSEDVARSAVIALPCYFEHDHPARGLVRSEDVFSALFDYLPRRHVSVGPDHQADVPEIQDTSNSPGYLDSDSALMGTCIIPMPLISDSSSCISGKIGLGRTDCLCSDAGSVRCVRQHVIEARENLKETLGEERFVELGFSNMGEDVANEWSEEEEQLFHEVVFKNPISSGNNFWDNLSLVFPSKTKKDLVSYYFNVFMLRRRVEQNRLDPSSADSDDDEYQGVNRTDEFEMSDNEDSLAESPLVQETVNHIKDNARKEEEPCDGKVWDLDFIDGPKKDVDFLPACDVIE